MYFLRSISRATLFAFAAFAAAFSACNASLTIEPVAQNNLVCILEMPDTLRLNAAGTDVEPNPFLVRYKIINVGTDTAFISNATIDIPSIGLDLDPAVPGNTHTRTLNRTLKPGDTAVVEWMMNVSGSIRVRDSVITIIAEDAQGNPIVCSHRLYIEPLPVKLTCDLKVSESKFVYDSVSQRYTNPTFTVTATLTNAGGFDLSGISARIRANDTAGYIQLDPAYTESFVQTWATIYQGETHLFAWHYQLARTNLSGVPQYVEFCIDIGSNETSPDSSACCVTVEIEPARPTGIAQSAQAVDFSLGQNYPNPFASGTSIAYTLRKRTFVKLAVYDNLGREAAVLDIGEKSPGSYSARLDASALPAGIYVYRLETSQGAVARKMVVMR